MKETELAKAVIAWLQDYKWEVYQEVQIFAAADVADIVAVQNNLTWVIECKNTLSLSVMAQAHSWKYFANYVSIATPVVRSSKGSNFAKMILRGYGIGHLRVALKEVHEHIAPTLYRNPPPRLRDALREEHKTWAEAGNPNCERYSPFKDTCKQVLREVEYHPGICVKEIVAQIHHHYRTPAAARSCIIKWADAGSIKGVKIHRHEGKVYFYPEGHPVFNERQEFMRLP